MPVARRVRRVMVGVTCWVVAGTLWSPRAEAIPNPVDWVIDGVGNIVGGGVSGVASAVADALFGKVLEFVTGLIAAAVTKATELLALAAALLVLLFFIIRIISALQLSVGTQTGRPSATTHCWWPLKPDEVAGHDRGVSP